MQIRSVGKIARRYVCSECLKIIEGEAEDTQGWVVCILGLERRQGFVNTYNKQQYVHLCPSCWPNVRYAIEFGGSWTPKASYQERRWKLVRHNRLEAEKRHETERHQRELLAKQIADREAARECASKQKLEDEERDLKNLYHGLVARSKGSGMAVVMSENKRITLLDIRAASSVSQSIPTVDGSKRLYLVGPAVDMAAISINGMEATLENWLKIRNSEL